MSGRFLSSTAAPLHTHSHDRYKIGVQHATELFTEVIVTIGSRRCSVMRTAYEAVFKCLHLGLSAPCPRS